MKVVIAHRSGDARVVELPEPKIGARYVTVRVSHSALILPEELESLDAAPRKTAQGSDGYPLGGTASGTIIEVGSDVKELKAGLRVAVTGAPYVYHASQLLVPVECVVELPKKVNHEEGAYAGQGAVALNLIRTAALQLGDTALVLGADMLGLLTAQLVRAAGATPVIVDDSDFRLAKSKTIGVPHFFEPTDTHLVKSVDHLTVGLGIDTAFLTRADDKAAWALAVNLLREGGTIVLGAPLNESVPLELLRAKGLHLLSTSGGGPVARGLDRWTLRDNMGCFCNLLAERKIQISPLITDRIPLERAPLAYEKARRGRDSALGIVLTV